MKRIFKGLIVLFGFVIALNVNAWEKSMMANALDTSSFTGDNFSINDIKLENYSESFGLTGKVVNSNSGRVNVIYKVSFYDKNNGLIAEKTEERNINSGNTNLNLMFDANSFNNYKFEDIAKYNLSVNVTLDNAEINKSLYPSGNDAYKKYDYVIDSYITTIIINKDNTYSVTEELDVYFNREVDSFERSIPYKVKDFKVNEDFNIIDNDNFKVKINSKASALSEKQYTFNYTIVMDDEHKDIDFDIIPKWNTAIGNSFFRMKLPYETSLDDLVFTFDGKLDYNSNNKDEILGSYRDTFENKSINIKLDLPDDYFNGKKESNEKKNINLLNYFWVPIVLIVGVIVLLSLTKKKEKIETL